MKTRLIVDISQMLYKSLFVNIDDIKEYGAGFLRHLTLSQLLRVVDKFKPDQVVVAFDSKSWRYKIYPEYKGNREKSEKIDWDDVYMFFDSFKKELSEVFPFVVLKVKWAEADDIIGTLVLDQENEWENIIISNDKDFKMLLIDGNTRIYDTTNDEYIVCDDPENFLNHLVYMGDRGDNIKGFAPRVGDKTAQKMVNDPKILQEKLNENPQEYRKNLKRNRILIDLRYVPKSLKQVIINQYRSYKPPKDKRNIIQYFSEYNLMSLSEDISSIDKHLKILRNSF